MSKEFFNETEYLNELLHAQPNEIKQIIQDLTPIQLMNSIKFLDKKLNKLKLLSIIEYSDTTQQLELIGKALSSSQFLIILENISNSSKEKSISIDKLSPLLVGLSPEIFFQSLEKASDNQLKALKHEGLLEPLENQILNLANYVENILIKNQANAQGIHKEIEELTLYSIGYEKLHEIQDNIETLELSYRAITQILDNALAITWNTHRIDLIEKLSQLKERVHFNFIHLIGSRHEPSTKGLNGILKKTLFDIYDQDFEKSNNEDKAIDGLAKLSIWYLQDYWELGLLPTIKNITELESNFSNTNEKLSFRQKIFDQVQENLNKLGLSTVGSLKRAEIFSRQMLEEYIKQNKNLLT